MAQKLLAASLGLSTVEKRGRNETQKYDYVRAEDIAEVATSALLARGVLCEFEVVRSMETPIKSRNGADGLVVHVQGQLIVTDTETGEEIRRRAIGSGSDYPGDKAVYKAMTGARKYAFIHLLGISIGDDPDEDHGQPSSRRSAKAKPKNPLPKARQDRIRKLIEDGELTYAQIDLALGAAGIDGLRAGSSKALHERVQSLTVDQADALEPELKASGEKRKGGTG